MYKQKSPQKKEKNDQEKSYTKKYFKSIDTISCDDEAKFKRGALSKKP